MQKVVSTDTVLAYASTMLMPSCHHVIMSSCHHAVKKKSVFGGQRNSIYNINIIYTISLDPLPPIFPKSLTAWWHNDMMTWRRAEECAPERRLQLMTKNCPRISRLTTIWRSRHERQLLDWQGDTFLSRQRIRVTWAMGRPGVFVLFPIRPLSMKETQM